MQDSAEVSLANEEIEPKIGVALQPRFYIFVLSDFFQKKDIGSIRLT